MNDLYHSFKLQVDAVWNSWSNWGSCDATCGDGVKSRTRTCTAEVGTGANCDTISPDSEGNRLSDTEACNDLICPGK